MSPRLDELLEMAAARPLGAPDVDDLVQTARTRRRRRRVISSAAVMVVAVVCVVAVARPGGEHGPGVHVTPADDSGPGTVEPESPHRLSSDDGRVSMTAPPSWTRHLEAERASGAVLVIGTGGEMSAFAAGCPDGGIWAEEAQSAWIAVYEFPADSSVVTPDGHVLFAAADISERPADFVTLGWRQGSCATIPLADASAPDNTFRFVAFREHGRLFGLWVARVGLITGTVSEAVFTQQQAFLDAVAIVETLVIEP